MATSKRSARGASTRTEKSRPSRRKATTTRRKAPGAARADSGAPGAPGAPGGPVASRPRIPPGYGVPTHDKRLLPWSHVEEKMSAAMRYWVASVDPEGRPHATPVDGLWLDGALYFGGAPTTRRSRNLEANAAACVHLEDAMDVVILHGDALDARDASPELIARLAAMSKTKYGWSPTPDQFAGGGFLVFRPRLALAWKPVMKDATRWRLEPADS